MEQHVNKGAFLSKLMPITLVLLGLLIGYFIIQTGDEKQKKQQSNSLKKLRLVETQRLEKGSTIPVWDSSGFVIPSETVKVHARVSGSLTAINPVAFPGGLLKQGEWLAKIERLDFELALKSEQAQLAQAKANLSLVEADQVLAKEELKLLNTSDELAIDEALVLRQPQLTVAQAKISVAQNSVDKAKLNLSRTIVNMPFDGEIIQKEVGVGSKVSTNTALFTVVNSDTYWLEIKIPHKFLPLLNQSAQATLSQERLWGENKTRQARFVSVFPELDKKDRQVKLLYAIDDPLKTESSSTELNALKGQTRHGHQSKQPQVFINDFLNVQLQGHLINNTWTIDHSWLQSDNTIWVVDKALTLQKRAVDIIFKGRNVIYVNADFEDSDLALSEKPGIASVGLPVRLRERAAKAQRNRLKQNKSQKTNTPERAK